MSHLCHLIAVNIHALVSYNLATGFEHFTHSEIKLIKVSTQLNCDI